MRKLELSDSLMTGHAVIDAEHDKIVSLINACLGIIESDENNDEEISDALLQL
ncbi:MAG: hemerythrin, partial [Rhodospirillales bacterium]|nr:hemerythrin [Rhodospirillales bacterium]